MIKRIVIYIPGTRQYEVPSTLLKAIGSKAKVVLCKYPATEKIDESSSHGAVSLRRLISDLQARYPKAKLYAIAQSQGGMVLAKAGIDDLLKGAILVGAPGFIKSKWPRYQHPFDFVGFNMPKQMPNMIDRLLSGDITSVPWFLKLAITHPLLTINAMLDAIGAVEAHNYLKEMPIVAGLLLDNEDV